MAIANTKRWVRSLVLACFHITTAVMEVNQFRSVYGVAAFRGGY